MNKRFTILYVDDEMDNLTAFRVIFRRYFNVLTTARATQVLDLVQQHPVDLILSDYKMPKMSGLELLEQIKLEYPHIVRLMITGFGEIDSIKKAVRNGTVRKMINKPWDVDELRSILEESLS